MRISALSVEWFQLPITAREAGVTIDPTGDTVTIAFTHGTDPVTADWETATWSVDETTTPPTYLARVLIGTGHVVLAAGPAWDAWVKVTDDPEIPVLRRLGALTIY